MLQDTTSMNPRGRVKLELYNDEGVYFTKEKKNLVVTSANEIVANMMSDPAKTFRLSQIDHGDTASTANLEGVFELPLSVQREVVQTATRDVTSTNTDTVFVVEGMQDVTKLISVKVGANDLVIDQDVFLKDAKAGTLEFAAAPTEAISVRFQKLNDRQAKIIEGTETVKIAGEVWKRGVAPADAEKVYAIDYATGVVKFEKAKVNVEVTYDVEKHYGLGFMGLGGKPAGHPDHQPVSFSQMDKQLLSMEAEFEDARMPIMYPAIIEEGKPELEVLPTKPMEFEELSATVIAADDDQDQVVDTVYQIDQSGKKLIELVSVVKKAQADGEEDLELVIGQDVNIQDAENAKIEFAMEPEEGDEFEVVYRLRANDLHLRYELALAPVTELVLVHYESADGVSSPVGINIEDKGLKIGSGDVWLLNANQGVLQFSKAVEDVITQPGQLTIQYKVNSGTVVKFVADFPKGVPGPVKMPKKETFVSQGETTFMLQRAVAKDNNGDFEVISVTRNGSDESYTVHADGTRIDVSNVVPGDNVVVEYKYLEEKHEIYQVAMFDEKDPSKSKMFNISGIGPVTKDENTGMRITWSVTF